MSAAVLASPTGSLRDRTVLRTAVMVCAAPDFLFAQWAGGAGRWPSYGVVAEGWPQPRQADGVLDVCSLSIPGWHVGVLYPLAGCRRARRRIFFLLNSAAALAAGRATGSSPTAGRSRGKLMVLDLALLIDAEDEGSVGRGKVRANDIAYLVDEQRIAR